MMPPRSCTLFGGCLSDTQPPTSTEKHSGRAMSISTGSDLSLRHPVSTTSRMLAPSNCAKSGSSSISWWLRSSFLSLRNTHVAFPPLSRTAGGGQDSASHFEQSIEVSVGMPARSSQGSWRSMLHPETSSSLPFTLVMSATSPSGSCSSPAQLLMSRRLPESSPHTTFPPRSASHFGGWLSFVQFLISSEVRVVMCDSWSMGRRHSFWLLERSIVDTPARISSSGSIGGTS
mmetsp:Transcript_33137/g.80274  ORF Transcript_33137/g.80274 Transcript_33137/m.80274 type:complete len:231 (-) Transcript_33137:665-1357(-)